MTTVTTNTVPTIDELINNVADTVKREYGATKDLAIRLCSEIKAFDGVQWFDVEHSDSREGAKPTLEVAQKFRDALRKAGHKNPSVMWTRVRNEGRNHVKALAVQAGEVSEDEGEGSGANAKRGLNLRLIEELSKLYKACKKDELVLTNEQKQAHTFITSALNALKVDPSMIK